MVEVEGSAEDLSCDEGESKRLPQGDGKHHTSSISPVRQRKEAEGGRNGRDGRNAREAGMAGMAGMAGKQVSWVSGHETISNHTCRN